MTSSKKTSKPLTPQQQKKLDELIEEGERLFGTRNTPTENPYLSRSAKKDSSKSKSKDGSKSKSGKGKSSDSAKKSTAADSPKEKTKSKSESPKKSAPTTDTTKAKGKSGSASAPKSAAKPKGKSVKAAAASVPQAPGISENFKKIPKRLIQITSLLVCLLMIWMFCEANIVQLKPAELFLPQLPYAFKGTRVMYLSDLHISLLNSPEKVNALIDQIMQLEPDLLLLGGDYTSADPLTYVRGTVMPGGAAGVQSSMRDLFFENLAQYNPPLGKFAVAGEHDALPDGSGVSSLEASAAKGGVTLLRNETVRIERGGQSLVIMGIDDWTHGEKNVRGPSQMVSGSDCVIVLCHNPEAIPLLNSYPASDGFWIDLALCGHTHGGIARVGSFELFNSTSDRQRFAAGWHLENSARVLISRGVTNDLLPLRFFASPEVHLITLK